MKLKTLTFALLVASLALQVPTAQGREINRPILRLQAKADSLYREGHWDRAYFIYVNELAPAGDKYAQYMAGYMSLHGKGVERNVPQAAAWYRLAAERGSPEFIKVRDELIDTMSGEALDISDQEFVRLRLRYSDLVLILQQLGEEREELLAPATGSRLPGESAPVTIFDPHSREAKSRAIYIRELKKRMRGRLDYLASKLGIEHIDPDMDDSEFEELESKVTEWLSIPNDLWVSAPDSE